VANVVDILAAGLQADYVVLGGGQTRRLEKVPAGVRLGDNRQAILGGLRLWDDEERPRARRAPKKR
jgi:hypothetical protein